MKVKKKEAVEREKERDATPLRDPRAEFEEMRQEVRDDSWLLWYYFILTLLLTLSFMRSLTLQLDNLVDILFTALTGSRVSNSSDVARSFFKTLKAFFLS